MTAVEQLAAGVAGFSPDDVPADVVERAKVLLLDSIGCAFAALDEPAAKACFGVLDAVGGAPACTVIGTSKRSSAINATLANAVLIRALDFNDGISMGRNGGSGGHPSILWAIALAVGEAEGSSGRDALAAGILGYEVYARALDLMAPPMGQPWDYAAATGLAGPALAGKLLGLDAERLADAMALGASHCNTLGVVRGYGELSMAKDLADPLNAQFGVLAALLARNGATGPRAVIESPANGWVELVARKDGIETLTAPFGDRWRTLYVGIKQFPCVGPAQSSVAAAIEARATLGGNTKSIARVDVRLPDTPSIREHVSNPARVDPRTRETADHSLPYLVAAALVDGEITVDQFHNVRWMNPDIREMMAKIRFIPDEALNSPDYDRNACVLELLTDDGRSERVELLKSHGGPSRDVVGVKFAQCARGVFSSERTARIIDTIDHLEKLPSVRPLLELLAAPA